MGIILKEIIYVKYLEDYAPPAMQLVQKGRSLHQILPRHLLAQGCFLTVCLADFIGRRWS